MTMRTLLLINFLSTLALLLSSSCSSSLAKKEDPTALFESIAPYGPCISQASFSFLYPHSYPPKNEAELKALCESQAEGIKCLKDKTRGSVPIVRRGAIAYVNTRNKHQKKVCTNTTSPQSRRLIEASKCVMDKRFAAYRANDVEMLQTLIAIARKNYNNSAVELKQLCCSFHFFRQNFTKLAGPECSQYETDIDEIGGEVATKDLEILCDNDEKLIKSCAKLERIQFKREPNYKPDGRLHAATLIVYLIATLGEPNLDPNFVIR